MINPPKPNFGCVTILLTDEHIERDKELRVLVGNAFIQTWLRNFLSECLQLQRDTASFKYNSELYCKPFIKRSFNSLWVQEYNSKFISLFRLVLSARLRNFRIRLKLSLFSESEIAQFIRSEVCYQKRVSPDKRKYRMIKWLSIPTSDRCIKFRLRAHILNDIIKKQLKQFILRHIKVNLNLIGLLKCDELNAVMFEYLNFWIWVSIIDFFFSLNALLTPLLCRGSDTFEFFTLLCLAFLFAYDHLNLYLYWHPSIQWRHPKLNTTQSTVA